MEYDPSRETREPSWPERGHGGRFGEGGLLTEPTIAASGQNPPLIITTPREGGAALFQSLANFSVLFLILMYLQGVRGLSPIHASLLLVPGYVIGGVVGPLAGRLTDRVGAVRPATAGLGLQVVTLLLYAQFQAHTALVVVAGTYVLGAIGAGLFFPANNAAVMKAAPTTSFGITSGLLRTFSNVGMVFSFALAIVVASASIPRREAFAIFVGAHALTAHEVSPFLSGLHAAFYASTSLMVLAAILSATRARRGVR